ESGNIHVYDLNTRKKIKEVKSENISKYVIHPTDNKIVYINNPSLLALDYNTGVKRELSNGYFWDFDISPDGKYLALAPFFDSSVHIIDYATDSLKAKYRFPLQPLEGISKVYFDPNGQGILVSTNLLVKPDPDPLKAVYEYGL